MPPARARLAPDSARRLCVAALSALLSAACGAPAVPIRLEAGLVFAEVRIDGQGPFTFILDTGATETVLTPRTARALGLRTQPVTATQATGVVRSLAAGAAEVRDLRVFVFDPPQALSLRLDHGLDYHGLLGCSFLERFVTTLDYGARQVTFAPVARRSAAAAGADEPVPPGAARVRFTLRDRLIHVPALVSAAGRSATLPFLLDTGAAEVVLRPAAATRLGLGAAPAGGAGAVDAQPRRMALDVLAVGAARAANVSAVVDALAGEAPPAGAYAGILGTPFLERFTLTLDYRERTLLLVPRAAHIGRP